MTKKLLTKECALAQLISKNKYKTIILQSKILSTEINQWQQDYKENHLVELFCNNFGQDGTPCVYVIYIKGN